MRKIYTNFSAFFTSDNSLPSFDHSYLLGLHFRKTHSDTRAQGLDRSASDDAFDLPSVPVPST